MSTLFFLSVALYAAQLGSAQNPGTTPDEHPPLTTYKCTTAGGCVAQDTAVVIDWGSHWIHTASGESCTTSSGGVNTTLCPDEATCAANCVIEGVTNYTASGVETSGDVLTMSQYVYGSSGAYQNASPRLYLLAPGGTDYVLLQLNGQELSFTVDLSTLPCGENGALYLSQMDVTGGRNQYDEGAASYGSGYCDAQCPVSTWRNGTLNTDNEGFCCNEMDVLEANSAAAAFTPHPCTAGNAACDSAGCGFNPYNQGYTNYWGPGLTVDTSKPFTIVTQFVTDDGTTTGTLAEIRRHYYQDGALVSPAVTGGDNITEPWCVAHDGAVTTYGGLPSMGEALGGGMVLVFSIWNDPSGYMDWLDEGSNGPCSSTSGDPTTIEADDPTTHVVFSNIRWGDIGSTTNTTTVSSSTSSSAAATSTSTTASRTSSAATTTTAAACASAQTQWGQCGGIGWSCPDSCQSGLTCTELNDYYYQCL